MQSSGVSKITSNHCDNPSRKNGKNEKTLKVVLLSQPKEKIKYDSKNRVVYERLVAFDTILIAMAFK